MQLIPCPTLDICPDLYRGPDPEGDKSGRGSEALASPAGALVVIRL